MKIQTALTQLATPEEAARELAAGLDNAPAFVVYFASTAYEPAAIAQAMQQAFPGATVVGGTTAGELGGGQMLKRSIVAMGFAAEALDGVHVELVKHPADTSGVEAAVKALGAKVGTPLAELDHTQYVGIVLVDGLSMSEEVVMDRLGDLTNVLFVGGSTGDDLGFKQTHLYVNGEVHSDAAVLVLLKPSAPFEVLKTQSFKVLDRTLNVTEADTATRTVLRFNDKPAAEAYAEAVGCSVEQLPGTFMRHPVGLVVQGEPYVRSPQQLKGDSVVFYCNVLEGMDLKLLESGDIVEDTRVAFNAAVERLGGVSGVLNFHCILRTLELEAKQQTEAYGALFKDVPAIGFSTYGECYLGHINQTSTMLLLH